MLIRLTECMLIPQPQQPFGLMKMAVGENLIHVHVENAQKRYFTREYYNQF